MKFVFIVLLSMYLIPNLSTTQLNLGDNTDDNLDFFSKCYEEIGCIDTDSRWYDNKLRPVNLRPLDRHVIKTDFLLIKRHEHASDDLLYSSLTANYQNLKISGLNFKSDLIILIHDFTSNGYTGWIKHVANVVFSHSLELNIVSVDWQRGAEPTYDQAIANARVVGLEIIAFLKVLKEKLNYKMSVHVIGHGIGAHIAGYSGSGYDGITKITGLDPSGPRFEGMPDIVKLNPRSAKYVEVIHTDAYTSRSQGTQEPMGHSDFYINNANKQMGCPENYTYHDVLYVTKTELTEGDILPGCSHKRAFKYFIESLEAPKGCKFLGVKCSSYDNFYKGKCSNCGENNGDCKTFGAKMYKTSENKISYYLNVADNYPFCMFSYKVVIVVKQTDTEYYGFFDFILVDDNGKATEANLATENNYRSLTTGNNTFIFYTYAPKLGRIQEAKVRWNEKKKFYCVIYCKQSIDVEKVVFTPLEITPSSKKYEDVLCPLNQQTEIENKAYRTFLICGFKEHSSTKKLTSTTKMPTSPSPTTKVTTKSTTKTTVKTTTPTIKTTRETTTDISSIITCEESNTVEEISIEPIVIEVTTEEETLAPLMAQIDISSEACDDI